MGVWGEGAGSERACRRTPCARESCDALSSPEPAARWFGGACGESASTEPRVPGLGRRGRVRRASGKRAPHAERAVILPAVQSLRRACSERGRVGRGRVRSLAWPGLVGRAGRRAPHARRESCDCSQQSRACGWLVRRGLVRRAGRRAPHAERAVILTAVQSLRLLVRRGCVRCCRLRRLLGGRVFSSVRRLR